MSQSPDSADGDTSSYGAGWSAISRLIRQGYSWSGHERNVAFLNLGDGTFADVSAVSGFGFEDDGRALASIDWDFDGDLDLFVTNRTGPRLRYLQNETPRDAAHFVAFRLVGTQSNRGGVGARVSVYAKGQEHPFLRTRRVGEGFLAQSSEWLHFGLGDAALDRVEVRWPGGATEAFQGVAIDRFHVLVEGSGEAREWNPPSVPEHADVEPAAAAPARRAARVVLSAPVPMPRLEMIAADGRTYPFLGIGPDGPRGTGKPLLINVWASWCAPCAKELAAFAGEKDVLPARLDVLALSVDEKGADAAALLERLQWPYTAGRLTPESLEVLDALEGAILDRDERLSLPTSFLVDAKGFLVALYIGPVEPAVVLSDLALGGIAAADRRDRAVPFAGRWHADPQPADLAYFEAELGRRGLARTAGEFAMGLVEVRQVTKAQLQNEYGAVRARQEQFEVAAEHFAAATQLDPYFLDAHAGLAYCLHRLERWEEAAAAYGEVLRLDPQNELSLFNLGLVHLEQEDLAAARRALARLVALSSQHAAELERRVLQAERK